jgi:hypothetical protein
MRREDDQQLWDLLGRAPSSPHLSDFFARNVVRRIREEPKRFEHFRVWFSLRRLIPATAMAMALIGAALFFRHPVSLPTAAAENAQDVVAQIDPQDFEVIADLDVLIASDETGLWDENQSL